MNSSDAKRSSLRGFSYNVIRRPKQEHGFLLILFFVALVAIGLTNLYSAASGTKMLYFTTQSKHLVLSTAAFAFCAWGLSVRHLNTYAYIFFGINFLLLTMVLVMGHTAGGAQRWILLGGFRFQPSETAKIVIAIYVAKFFYNNKQIYIYGLRELAPVMLGCLATFFLIFKQPDLGTAGLCLLIAASQVLFIRIRMKSILIVAGAGFSAAIAGWFFFLHDYQRLRILNLLNPNLDPQGTGYNSLQSLVAIGSGGLFGKGFLEGTQSHLSFLPARHTDFIFSVFAEEHGFWGGILVFALFGGFTYVGLEIARSAKDTFNSLLAVGMTAFIFLEFLINVSMVLGLFPVVGMPLPFFSYGGSSLISLCIAVGILVAIDRDNATSRHGSVGGGKSFEKIGI